MDHDLNKVGKVPIADMNFLVYFMMMSTIPGRLAQY
jgi:hypothetical protein